MGNHAHAYPSRSAATASGWRENLTTLDGTPDLPAVDAVVDLPPTIDNADIIEAVREALLVSMKEDGLSRAVGVVWSGAAGGWWWRAALMSLSPRRSRGPGVMGVLAPAAHFQSEPSGG